MIKNRRKKSSDALNIYVLSEKDFYPPDDNRFLKSGIRGVYGGDNFLDYVEYIHDILEELYQE